MENRQDERNGCMEGELPKGGEERGLEAGRESRCGRRLRWGRIFVLSGSHVLGLVIAAADHGNCKDFFASSHAALERQITP